MGVNSFFKLLYNFGAKILRDQDFVYFCARYKNPVIGITWGVNHVNFEGLGTCLFMLYRGRCGFLVGVGARCGAVLFFSIL